MWPAVLDIPVLSEQSKVSSRKPVIHTGYTPAQLLSRTLANYGSRVVATMCARSAAHASRGEGWDKMNVCMRDTGQKIGSNRYLSTLFTDAKTLRVRWHQTTQIPVLLSRVGNMGQSERAGLISFPCQGSNWTDPVRWKESTVQTVSEPDPQQSPGVVQTRSGREVIKPKRLDLWRKMCKICSTIFFCRVWILNKFYNSTMFVCVFFCIELFESIVQVLKEEKLKEFRSIKMLMYYV